MSNNCKCAESKGVVLVVGGRGGGCHWGIEIKNKRVLEAPAMSSAHSSRGIKAAVTSSRLLFVSSMNWRQLVVLLFRLLLPSSSEALQSQGRRRVWRIRSKGCR